MKIAIAEQNIKIKQMSPEGRCLEPSGSCDLPCMKDICLFDKLRSFPGAFELPNVPVVGDCFLYFFFLMESLLL